MALPDRYLIPHILDFHFKLYNSTIFSKMYLVRAFYRVPVAPEDVPKTEYPMLNFGLRNAAQTSQSFMNRVVSGLEFVTVYIEDILVASSSQRQHIRHIHQLFERPREYGLRIHPVKCIFGVVSLDFLGHRVLAQKITPSHRCF